MSYDVSNDIKHVSKESKKSNVLKSLREMFYE